MNDAVSNLLKCKIFFVATSVDGQPYVRPFGAVFEWEGKPYLCTNNQKNVFKQIRENSNIQICGLLEGGSWVRVTAQAIPDSRQEVKIAMLEAIPGLKNMYQPEDGLFEVLRLENAVTEIH